MEARQLSRVPGSEAVATGWLSQTAGTRQQQGHKVLSDNITWPATHNKPEGVNMQGPSVRKNGKQLFTQAYCYSPQMGWCCTALLYLRLLVLLPHQAALPALFEWPAVAGCSRAAGFQAGAVLPPYPHCQFVCWQQSWAPKLWGDTACKYITRAVNSADIQYRTLLCTTVTNSLHNKASDKWASFSTARLTRPM